MTKNTNTIHKASVLWNICRHKKYSICSICVHLEIQIKMCIAIRQTKSITL